MRDDIAKKLCERPRRGGGGKTQFIKYERRAGKDPRKWDILPKKESMKRPNIRGWNGKYLNEFFPPLLGFLKKSVNRPWDKVFSEVCEHLSPSSATQKHVFDHLLRDFVELKPFFKKDSKVPYRPGYRGFMEVHGFYVDPHGLLKNNDDDKARKRLARERKHNRREAGRSRKRINDLEEYRRIAGAWFHVWYKHIRAGQSGYDMILHKEIVIGRWGNSELERSNGRATRNGKPMDSLVVDRYRICITKWQVSKKEIRLEGLNKL